MNASRTFDELRRTPESHFRLHIYAAVLGLRGRLPEPDEQNGLGFLRGYYEQIDAGGFDGGGPEADARWSEQMSEWEGGTTEHLPLRALREACGLDQLALSLLFTVGLLEEDIRFGVLFEAMGGVPGEHRPTVGLLANWTDDDRARDGVQALLQVGVLREADADVPRPRRGVYVPPVVWDAMRGGTPAVVPWALHRPAGELATADELLLPEATRRVLERLPILLSRHDSQLVIVRGPRGSGRRALLGAVARSIGRGLLELTDPPTDLVGPVATLLNAVPMLELEPSPGERVDLHVWAGYVGPAGVLLGARGGVQTAANAITLRTGVPDLDARASLWSAALGRPADSHDLAARFRIPSGTIRRSAQLAQIEATLAGRIVPNDEDVLGAMRSLHGEALETLATRVPASGDWRDLAVGDETLRELELLELRCRHRERLRECVGGLLAGQLTPGVRVLLTGPSGAGKTLAVRLLASVLGKELYAVDLSAVVNKYIGETQKNLDAVFARAEELDVILLLDEGDALLTRRTDVHTSNDRYANLETNYLLQRLESYEGILVVTTNAGERIDGAFKRRMDVVVELWAPGPLERWQIWRLHLPPGHVVGGAFLEELSARCALTGGQIRNAALHASLLALDGDAAVGDGQLEAAVRREYRKSGLVCPLRATEALHG